MEEKNNMLSQGDVDAVLALLEGFMAKGESRVKINVVEGDGEMVSHNYHHGRCDVGSPWACGASFDVLEPEAES